MADTINRNLYYYDFDLMQRDQQTKKMRSLDSFELLIREIFQYFMDEYDNNIKNIELELTNGDKLFIIVDELKEDYIEYRMVLGRTDALPFVEKEGVLESLEKYLDGNQNIAEVTHCVLFPRYKIIGAEYNFAGARASAISKYIQRLNPEIGLVTCRPKLNFDAYKELLEGDGFSLFDLAVKSDSRAYQELLAKKHIFRALRETISDSDTIEIIVKKKNVKKGDNTGFEGLLSTKEVKELITEYRDDVARLKVSQGTITNDAVNLLSDKLVKSESFTKLNGRMIDSTSVYMAIKRFFYSTVKEYCE